MITLQNENDSKIIKKAQTFQENHDNNKIIEEERDEPINEEFKQKIKIDKKLEHKDDGLKKTKTIQGNQKLTLSTFVKKTEQQKKDNSNKEEIQQIKTKTRENDKTLASKKVTFKGIENVKEKFVDTIDVNSYKNDNRIVAEFLTADDIETRASIFVQEIKNKNDTLNVFDGFSINKQALIENKPKIGFWEGIFCCCSADVIRRRQTSVVIDKIIERHPDNNNDNILLNTDEINAINKDIQTYMGD